MARGQVPLTLLLLDALSESLGEGQGALGKGSACRPGGRRTYPHAQARSLDHQTDPAEPSSRCPFDAGRCPFRPQHAKVQSAVRLHGNHRTTLLLNPNRLNIPEKNTENDHFLLAAAKCDW